MLQQHLSARYLPLSPVLNRIQHNHKTFYQLNDEYLPHFIVIYVQLAGN